MQNSNATRLRLGSLALGASALVFAAFQFSHPVTSLDLSDPGSAARTFGSPAYVLTDSLLVLCFTLLPLSVLTLYAQLRNSAGERWAFAGMILTLLSVSPFVAFTGVGAYAFSAAAQSYLQGNKTAFDVIALILAGPSLPLGLVGVLLFVLGSIALGVAIWRSGSLPKWAGVMYAIGFVLFFPAVSSPISIQQLLRIIDGLLVGIGGVWLGLVLWHRPISTISMQTMTMK